MDESVREWDRISGRGRMIPWMILGIIRLLSRENTTSMECGVFDSVLVCFLATSGPIFWRLCLEDGR